MRLSKKLKEPERKFSGEIPVTPSEEISVPYGIMIDGVVYPLEGQPPVAVPKPWLTGNVDSGH